jgi:hypothetical protein
MNASTPSRTRHPASTPWQSLLELARDIVGERLESHFKPSRPWTPRFTEDPRWESLHHVLAEARELAYADKVVFLLALTPHLQPGFWENLILHFVPAGGDFPELGGVKGAQHRGMLPTGETAQFIVAGMDIDARLQLQRVFDQEHIFHQRQLLWLEDVRESEPFMSGRLIVSHEWLDKALFGREIPPRFSAEFPAKLVTTRMDWSDLVLHPFTADRVADIKRWLEFHLELEKDVNLSRRIQTGYRVLFYGPPGTGKTLTAMLIGKHFKKDLYRVDLSQIVSKYIGETEKNLNRIFDRAQNKDWILFFDEADALFGKRTNVQSSHDKFANQEVSFLLQRVEDFSGLMILASNFKTNIDDAFLRRFHAIVHFPMPTAQERLRLWKESMPASVQPASDVDLRHLAEAHELNGATIVNVIQHATLRAFSRKDRRITQEDLSAEIHRELKKDERSL